MIHVKSLRRRPPRLTHMHRISVIHNLTTSSIPITGTKRLLLCKKTVHLFLLVCKAKRKYAVLTQDRIKDKNCNVYPIIPLLLRLLLLLHIAVVVVEVIAMVMNEVMVMIFAEYITTRHYHQRYHHHHHHHHRHYHLPVILHYTFPCEVWSAFIYSTRAVKRCLDHLLKPVHAEYRHLARLQ